MDIQNFINNQDIINFINENFNSTYGDLEEEIESIIDNLIKDVCFIPSFVSSLINIGGLDNNVNTIESSYLIPNLFRKCYSYTRIRVPGVCPNFVYKTRSLNFLPQLIDENLIKSFLYFNFPVNIRNIDLTYSFLKNILNIQNTITKKKRDTTYASFTNCITLYNEVYPANSMLTQLVLFNNYLNKCYVATIDSQIINTYTVLWEFTSKCLCYSGNLENTFIEGNNNYNTVISNTYGTILHNIKNGVSQNIPYYSEKVIQFLIKNSFYKLSAIVEEVFSDVIIQLQNYVLGLDYCPKEYMNPTVIPELIHIYQNFYNNQIYTISKAIPKTPIYSVIPQTITIQSYIDQFVTVYATSTSTTPYLAKQVLLDGSDGINAFVFYSSIPNYSWNADITTILNNFFYINILNPSALNLTNVSDFNTSTINDYISNFNTISPYSNYTANNINTYLDGALYPTGGTTSDALDVGYSYSYTNSDGIIKYLVYFMGISIGPWTTTNDNAQFEGVSLVYYTNYNIT